MRTMLVWMVIGVSAALAAGNAAAVLGEDLNSRLLGASAHASLTLPTGQTPPPNPTFSWNGGCSGSATAGTRVDCRVSVNGALREHTTCNASILSSCQTGLVFGTSAWGDCIRVEAKTTSLLDSPASDVKTGTYRGTGGMEPC